MVFRSVSFPALRKYDNTSQKRSTRMGNEGGWRARICVPFKRALTTVILLPTIAAADFDPNVELSGFGTLGYSISDSDTAEYRLGKALNGVDSSGSFLLDTRLGVQLDTRFHDKFSATAQVLFRDDEDGDFTPDLEWAFARWSVSDSWTLRLGRMSLPTFNLSDYREVGYATEFLRPPEDTYAQVPLRRFDGIDLIGHFEFDDVLLSTEILFGRTKENLQNNTTVETDALGGVAFSVSKGVAKLRLSHVETQKAQLTNQDIIALGEVLTPLIPLIPSLEEVTATIAPESNHLTFAFSGLSLELDFDRVFVDAEYTLLKSNSYIGSIIGWYVATGYRYGAFTPYVFTSRLRRSGASVQYDIPEVEVFEPLQETLDSLFFNPNQATTGVGLRWDFKPDLAFKFQLENISRDEIGLSFFRTGTSDQDTGDDVVLASFNVDFIF